MGREKVGDLLQGTLDMLVLKALTSGPKHGYATAGRAYMVKERNHWSRLAAAVARVMEIA